MCDCSLVEISRRRAYRRSITSIGKEAETKLNALRTTESKLRDQFHSSYQLPKGFLASLHARPTQWVLSLTDSDQPLPEIDDSDSSASSVAAPSPEVSASGSDSLGDAKSAAAADDKLRLDRLSDENKMLRAELALLKANRPLSQTTMIATLRNNDSPAQPIDESVAFTPHHNSSGAGDSKAVPSSTQLQSTIERQTAELNELKRAADAERAKREELLASAIKRAETASAAADAAAAALTQEQKRAVAELEALRKTHETESARLSGDVSTLTDKLGAISAIEQKLRKDVESQAKTLADSTAAATAIEQSLRSDVAALQQKLASANSALEKATAAVLDATAAGSGGGGGSGSGSGSEIASAAKHAKDCHEAVERTTTMLREKIKEISERNATIERQNKKISELSANTVSVELELKRTVDESKAKIAALKKEYESQLSQRDETINKLKTDQKTHETQCTAVTSNLVTQNKALEKEKAAANSEIKTLKDENAAWKVELASKITFRSFHEQDTALFIRNSVTGFYEALNRNAANYFLALDQKGLYEPFGEKVLGRIVMKEKDTAGSASGGNPYKLPNGTVYYRVYAEFESADGKPDSSKDGKSPAAKPNGGSGPDGKRDK